MKKSVVVGLVAVLLLALPTNVWAAYGADGPDFARLFWVLAIMLLAGKFSGELAERMGQPAVLGELLAGAILGGSLLGIIPTVAEDALTPVVEVLAEIGVVILLFEIGLQTDLKAMARVGKGAAAIAVVGVVLPMIGGIFFWLSPLANHAYGLVGVSMTAVFIGATLTATSVGITARVLQDLRVMHCVESRLIIGAAVIDDILGLVLLGLVSTLAAGGAVTVLSVGKSLAVAVGFLVVAVGVGLRVAPMLFDLLNRMRVRGMLLVTAFSFLLIVAALADQLGSAMIVGAFAAGLILSGTNQFDLIEERIKRVADIFTPIFFLSIGAKFDVGLLNPFVSDNLPVLGMGLALFFIAIVGKVAAGWAVPWRRFNRVAVGVGMIPRGEVGLIFANMGLVMGVLSTELFGSIIIMVIGTTFVAPPFLKVAFGRGGVTVSDGTAPL
jgi:Kef-type K+ transport system membrane component KefB